MKFSLNLLGRTKQTAELSTTGDYDIYYETLHDMPNHGFHDYELIESTGKLSYGFDTRLYGEFGGMIRPSVAVNTKYCIGAFVEYGLLNTMPKSHDNDLFEPDLSQYMQVHMNHIHTTPIASSLHNMTFGVCFSVLFHIGGSINSYSNTYSSSLSPLRSSYSPIHCNCLR